MNNVPYLTVCGRCYNVDLGIVNRCTLCGELEGYNMTEDTRKMVRDIARNAYVTGYEAGFAQGKKEAKRLILALGIWAVIIAVGVALVGCAPVQPFAEYEHLSQPNVADDGYDLGCLGVETNYDRVRLSAAACENFARGSTDTFAKLNVRVNLGRE